MTKFDDNHPKPSISTDASFEKNSVLISNNPAISRIPGFIHEPGIGLSDMTDKSRFKLLPGFGWHIYDNANFSIHVTEKCNADCDFCVAHLRYLQDNVTYFKPEISSDDKYFKRLSTVLSEIKSIKPSVSITGGEPTVNKRISGILDVLMDHKDSIRKRTLTTNATGLLTKLSEKENLLDKLGRYGLEHLNISHAHYNNDKNNELMKMQPHLLDESKLHQIIEQAHSLGIKVRISCVLLKSGISTITEINKYLQWAVNMGVDTVIFRQLMSFSPKVEKSRITLFCEDNSVSLIPIWNQMDADDRYKLVHTVRGYYYYVEVRHFNVKGNNKQLTVVGEMADLNKIPDELAYYGKLLNNPEKVAFEMVYHPNGNLCGGWREFERIISESDN